VDNNEINWGEVVDFFAKKYVSIKAALAGSNIDVQGDNVCVNLKSKSKFMLEQRNSNKLIEEYIKNSFGKIVNVTFKEQEIVEDSLSKEQEIIRNLMEKNKQELA
jgi:hypothetical protein